MTLTIQSLQSERAGPFDLTVARGQCAAITGASGSGKSVFLRMVADLDPCSGAVALGGIDRAAISAPLWRRRVGLVPAQAGWWSDRVRDHFATEKHAEVVALADALQLPAHIVDRRIVRLSSGERQRLALIRALIAEPDALLLDEPTASLDADTVTAVETLLRSRLQAGMILLLVTHDPAQAARMAHVHRRVAAGTFLAA
jgi:ABC-type iron transport system FetAB ATPase subunit